MPSAKRWIYFFGNGKADGRGDQKDLLGGKGAGLAEMTRIGLPVPAGFTLTTETCKSYNERGKKWPPGLDSELRQNIVRMEKTVHKRLGGAKDPLLVSVRSGAARSMPGMMETILNLGLNDKTVEALAQVSGDERFAFDAYRRLIMMYGSTVKGIDRCLFEDAFHSLKEQTSRARLHRFFGEKILDTEVDADELRRLVGAFKEIYSSHASEEFPQDPFVQIRGAINAVFDSWMAEKAMTYRRVERITGLHGTAVNVCQMVFGNMGDDSGTGVCFTRDPSTGESTFYGDLLINAQGEDVVAGVRTPLRLSELSERMPEVYRQLEAVRVILETHYRDMQDLEFTFERGKLYMLQTRSGKRSPSAAFKIAVDQATRGLVSVAEAKALVKSGYLPKRYVQSATRPTLTRDEAIGRVTAADVERLFYPVVDSSISPSELKAQRLTEGIGAVPGAACGVAVFSAEEAESLSAQGHPVILIRKETSPEDVGGMHVSVGVLTATGGKTSHAAVVARGWGKCCIVGCESLDIDYTRRQFTAGGRVVRAGDYLTLDGGTGVVYAGKLPLVRPTAPPEFETLMGWCDDRRRLRVRANADTPADAIRAVALGAEGIGLCRTEHMFFDSSQAARLISMREMIVAESSEARSAALEKLLPFQRQDFEGIFEAMDGLPVTIRLIDPPLHEFLPQADNEEGLRAVADSLNAPLLEQLNRIPTWDIELRRSLQARCISIDDVRRRVVALHESNPMLGHRGCRLCITYPEILDMQVRAIMEAAVACTQRGVKVIPEIMIPLTIDSKELQLLEQRTRKIADAILSERKAKIRYLVGTMIETPRAALTSDRMALHSDFFSYGTNDLTQLTMGLSRDDAGRFLPEYVDEARSAILPSDPFQSIDVVGVGLLVQSSADLGRAANDAIKLGVCGEHGGDPESIRFFDKIQLHYVSCSPFRVPVARLAAAQSSIELRVKAPKKASTGATKKSSRNAAASGRNPQSGKSPSKTKSGAALGGVGQARRKSASAAKGAAANKGVASNKSAKSNKSAAAKRASHSRKRGVASLRTPAVETGKSPRTPLVGRNVKARRALRQREPAIV